jgi:hypothetical protein
MASVIRRVIGKKIPGIGSRQLPGKEKAFDHETNSYQFPRNQYLP